MNQVITTVFMWATAITLGALLFMVWRLSRRPQLNVVDYLKLERGDLVVVDNGKVVVKKFGAVAVEKHITRSIENKEDATITFKTGRKVQVIRIM